MYVIISSRLYFDAMHAMPVRLYFDAVYAACRLHAQERAHEVAGRSSFSAIAHHSSFVSVLLLLIAFLILLFTILSYYYRFPAVVFA